MLEVNDSFFYHSQIENDFSLTKALDGFHLQRTDRAVEAALLTSLGGDNPYLALGVIFLGSSFMTNVITNNAAAAFMFPIALATASQLGVSFMPFAVTLMISASCAFITPTGYQTNLMIWGPGGYDFMDFVKIGTVMTIIVAVMTIVITPIMFTF